jgi:hypothetical protein
VIDLDELDELDELAELDGLSIADSFNLQFRMKFAKKHPTLTWFFFALPICLPVIGAVIFKRKGLLGGFFLGIFILWLGPYIYTKQAGDEKRD